MDFETTPFDRDTFDDDVTLTSTPPTGTMTPLEDDFESLVEPIKPPMTLADDRLNKMTDDVDLDLFDTTPQDTTTPIATDQIGTFDADTFDDEVGSRGPRTIEFDDSDFTDKVLK